MSKPHIWYDRDKKTAKDFLNRFREDLDEQRKTKQLEINLLNGMRIILIRVMDSPEKEFKAADLHSMVRSTVQYFPVKAFIQLLEADKFFSVRTHKWSVNGKITTYVSLNPTYFEVINELGIRQIMSAWLTEVMTNYLAIVNKFGLDEELELCIPESSSDDD